MLKTIEIKSLKSIEDVVIKFSNLNIFVGPNSAGKSTILQSLLLLSQNSNSEFGLNGFLVSLGDFREARNFNVKSDYISIKATTGDEYLLLKFIESSENNLGYNIISETGDKSNIRDYFDFSKGKFNFLSSERIGYQDVYIKNMSNTQKIGINGEYAINYLKVNSNLRLDNKMIKFETDYTLLAQVNYWLNYIVNADIRIEDLNGTDVIKVSYEVGEAKNLRPKNIGAGTSYLVSIIILCLSSSENDILIIESPEIHLHPSAQSKLCEFLYFICSGNRQLFVETHSDHIFNGVRAGIATNKMRKDNIKINYVELDKNNCSKIENIDIENNGKIKNNYPELFNQFDYDLDKMLGL